MLFRSAARARESLAAKPDWITFTSSSTVTNFMEAAGREALAEIRIASIGPITSEAIRAQDLSVDVEASPHTIPGLVQAILGAK